MQYLLPADFTPDMSLTSSELHQTIRLAKIPDGWRMVVTAVNPMTSDNNKYTSRVDTPGGKASNAEGALNNFQAFEVTKRKQSNKVATVEFKPHMTFQSQGPSGDIHFTITGTTIVNGQAVTAKSKGMITVSSSIWSMFSRPDVSVVTIVLDGVARTILLPVSMGGIQPSEVHLFFSTNGEALTLVAAPAQARLTDMIASAMISGIFEVHRELFSFGVTLPFAAAEASAALLAKTATEVASEIFRSGAAVLYASVQGISRSPAGVDVVRQLTTC